MRRKSGALFPIERSILGAGLDLADRGRGEFHGYAIAKEIGDREDARRLAAQGTLYRALDRLEGLGLVESRLENADLAAAENRPRRRLYRVTALGERAHAAAPQPQRTASGRMAKGVAPT